jgi:hypothetical protein
VTLAADGALSDGLTWARLADMRPHRLKRGKHFRGDPRELQAVAADAASELDLTVHTMRDELRKYQYVWVQFAELRVDPGCPCPRCGALRLARSGGSHFARCTACHARLLIVAPKGSRAVSEPREEEGREADQSDDELVDLLKWAGRPRISLYFDTRLAHDDERSDDRFETWYGRGTTAEGRAGILEVVYPLRGGARVPDPDIEGEDLHRVHFWSIAVFRRAVQLGVLKGWEPAGFLSPRTDEGAD